jgi:hypothetical protein
MLAAIQFKRLSKGAVAYYQGQPCQAYFMCIEGRTRVFKNSESGRAILLYEVGPGETCVLTTTSFGWWLAVRFPRKAPRCAAGYGVPLAD